MPPPPSFTALVASYDEECSKYTAISTSQAATVELIASFKPMMKELLKRWQQKNHGLMPNSIIYWRDGIAESQVEAFKESEIKALREVCEESKEKIKVTVINCVKRYVITGIFGLQHSEDMRDSNLFFAVIIPVSFLDEEKKGTSSVTSYQAPW